MPTNTLTRTSDATLAPPKTLTRTSDAEVHLGLLLTSDADLILTAENSTTLTSDSFLAYEFSLNLTSDSLLEFEPEPPEPPTPPEPEPQPPLPQTRTCAVFIDCPGIDSPVSNFSSEGADPLIFVGTSWPSFNPYRPPPLGGGLFYARDCFGNQISAVSQEDADLISYTQAQICQDGQKSYQTQEQTACGTCPDGVQFCYTVPAFTFVAPQGGGDETAEIDAANAQALAYAERQVSILRSQGICNRQTCSIKNSSPLPNGKLAVAYSYQFVAGGAVRLLN